jgi:serine/threonine-protein kinase
VHADLLHGEERDEFTARFRREAQAAARCAHPNVVAVYDFALHAGNPYLAMEFIDGVTLAALRKNGEVMSPAQAVRIITQVLAGLGAAHSTGIIHRDIKPANIMLTRSGVAKVADFGISRIESSSLTSEGMLVGTPSYMSPEQCRGESVDSRSDLYSVGVVLYELLTGSRPFAGTSAGALYLRLVSEDAPDVRERQPDLPPALATAVARSLARGRDARFPTAAAMAEALQAALGGSEPAESTVVMSGRAAPAKPELDPTGLFDEQTMATLERKLVEHVGPIARYLVQSAVRKATDVDSLCASLAAKIDHPADRDRFTREVRATLTSGGTTSGGKLLTLAPGEQDRLQAALTRYLGPVARVMIKRALPGASSVPALWHSLGDHIEDPKDRAEFLRQAPG